MPGPATWLGAGANRCRCEGASLLPPPALPFTAKTIATTLARPTTPATTSSVFRCLRPPRREGGAAGSRPAWGTPCCPPRACSPGPARPAARRTSAHRSGRRRTRRRRRAACPPRSSGVRRRPRAPRLALPGTARSPANAVAELAHRLEAIVRRLRERLRGWPRRIGSGRAHPLGHRLDGDRRLRHVLRRPLPGRVGLEGELAGEHLVRHHAERVDVAARVDGLARELLGAHVRRRPEHHALLGELLLVLVFLARPLGDAEVEDLHEVLLPGALDEHHVVGLEVAVHDAAPVRLLERAADLLR